MLKSQLLEVFPIGPEIPDHRRHDPVSAIAGGVGLVSNIAGGFIGSSAANKAAQIQQQAAKEASDKVGVATNQANTGIADATQAGQGLITAGGQRVIDTAGAAKAGVDEAARNANGLLDPYATTGNTATSELNKGLAAGGDFNKMPTMADIQIDPGYAFRQAQADVGLNASAAARGGALGSGAMIDLMKYNSGLASQEYQNAFNRFETATQNRFGNLMTASNAGQAAAGTQGSNLIGAGQYGGNITTGAANTALGANEAAANMGVQGQAQIGQNVIGGATQQGNILTGGANAAAASTIAKGNAWSGALAGGANSVANAGMMNLLKNPATTGGLGPWQVGVRNGGGLLMPPGYDPTAGLPAGSF
jgi:hypothetical protein